MGYFSLPLSNEDFTMVEIGKIGTDYELVWGCGELFTESHVWFLRCSVLNKMVSGTGKSQKVEYFKTLENELLVKNGLNFAV